MPDVNKFFVKPVEDPTEDFKFGMIRNTNQADSFEFSEFGLCNNWEVKLLSDVLKYRDLGVMKCTIDDKYYKYYRFVFAQPLYQ